MQKKSQKALLNSEKVIWQPQPKQALVMSRPEYEILYGGAAGGGKSDYLVVEALRQIHIPHYRGIIIRKTFPQLQDVIDRSAELYPVASKRARYNKSDHCWTFPSGAKIYFGSMQHSQDKHKYQGRHYDFIGFDELTHFTFDEYNYLFSRNRPSGPGTRTYIRSTANPGGIGHGWVKERFISCAKPGTTIRVKLQVRDPYGKTIELYKTRVYIQATVFDNKKLLENDPNYLASLAMLPPKNRDALLYGDWDSFEGQVFTEFKDDPDGYYTQKFTHVIKPFAIPASWKIYRGFDFGYAKPFSVGWYAVDHEGCIYRIKEFYGCTDVPNTGIKIEPAEIARQIREIENTDENLKGRQITGIADPSIFDESRGESVGAIMERFRVYWEPGDNTRLAGKMQYHYRLAFDEKGRSMFYVFDTCTHFIRTIPALVYDEKRVEDVDTSQEDHIYDECRYVLMEHPIAPRRNEAERRELGEDPLDMFKKPDDKYYFYRL